MRLRLSHPASSSFSCSMFLPSAEFFSRFRIAKPYNAASVTVSQVQRLPLAGTSQSLPRRFKSTRIWLLAEPKMTWLHFSSVSQVSIHARFKRFHSFVQICQNKITPLPKKPFPSSRARAGLLLRFSTASFMTIVRWVISVFQVESVQTRSFVNFSFISSAHNCKFKHTLLISSTLAL